MSKPFLSVIIPVYNVEKYLRQCVDSVLNQNLSDYELILVDDGSPDCCPEICDEYASKHAEIRVIHQNNQGLSEARNAGINISRGKYLMFMDSDDWWNPDVNVTQMLAKVREKPYIEMFLFNSIDYIDGDGYYNRREHDHLKNIRTDNVLHYYQDLLKNGNLEVSACTKIISQAFLINNDLHFQTGLLGEDNHWMIRVLRSLESVEILSDPLYICRISRADSITHTISRKNISDMLTIVSESLSYCNKINDDREILKCELCFDSYLWFSALGLSQSLSKKDRKELMQVFQDTAVVCKFSNSPKTKLAYTVFRLMGINITGKLLGMYIKVKRINYIFKDKI